MTGREGSTPKVYPFSKIPTLSLEEVRKGIFYLTNREWAAIRKNVPLSKEAFTHGPGVLVCPHPSGDFLTALITCAAKSGPDKVCIPQLRRTPEGCLEIVGCACYEINKPSGPDRRRSRLLLIPKTPRVLLSSSLSAACPSCVSTTGARAGAD